jgi:tetratricopeptide (TPR) repeat protein
VKSFFTLWYKATRPVPGHRSLDPVILAQKSKQRRLLKRTGALILTLAAGSYAYTYFADAPKRAHAEVELGVKKMAPGSYTEAIAHLDRAIGISPDLAEAYLIRGVAEHHSNRRAEALADLDKALDLDDHLTRAYNERGQIYLENGDAKKALPDFTESLRLKPNLEGYYQRGQVYEQLGQHANAIADFTAGIAEAPDAPYVYRARAAAKRNSGDREGAAADEAEADRIEGKQK